MVTFDPTIGSGGIEGRTNAYTACLLKRGFHVEVAAVSPAGRTSEEPYLGTRLVHFSSGILNLPRTFSALVRMITSSSLDSVFFLSGGSTPIGVLLLGFSKFTGRKTGIFFYGRDVLQARRRPVGLVNLVLSIMLAGKVATNSQYTANLLPVRPRNPPILLYPGVDPDIASVVGVSRDVSSPHVLFVGRLIKRKGADILLESFGQLRSRARTARLDIVGDGPEMTNLRSLTEGLFLEDVVTFYGALYGTSLWKRYAEASIFVMPSRESSEDAEGFGTVFLEAGAFGVPSIGSRTGGIPEAVIDGVTGKLVESEDVDGLAETIKGLLDNPDELNRLGKNARARAQELSWEASTDEVLQLMGAQGE